VAGDAAKAQSLDVVQQFQKKAEGEPHTCEKTASEVINGEATSLVVIRVDIFGRQEQIRYWISDRSGLPLKGEARLINGTFITAEIRYDNITAPPVAK
jgi:hypothetical protein